MCQLCEIKENNAKGINISDVVAQIRKIHICGNVKAIPADMINVTEIHINYNSYVKYIPDTLVNLEFLDCHTTIIKCIPPTLVKLERLYCDGCLVDEIPTTLTKLEKLYIVINTKIPTSLINLNELHITIYDGSYINSNANNIRYLKCNPTYKFDPHQFDRLHCNKYNIREIDLRGYPKLRFLQTCSCIVMKGLNNIVIHTISRNCYKDLKQVQIIQKYYRMYRFKRNSAIWNAIKLPYVLHRLVICY